MFEIIAEDGDARCGILKTDHGNVETPSFKAVATKGAVKMLTTKELREMGAQAIISNAFILSLRPGLDILEAHGGLHKFMNWDGVSYTDCGGFQVLSLEHDYHMKTTDAGISFRSPFDGKPQLLSPQRVMDIEAAVGSDIAMALDHMPLYGCSYDEAVDSMNRTHLWMKECKRIHKGKTIYGHKQLLFGIAQGSVYPDLRRASIKYIDSLDFDGIAFGGLAVGEPKDKMFEMIKISAENCSKKKPRYVMGLGSPRDLLEAISMGVDTFDSIFPTKNARHGNIFTRDGPINIENAPYKDDMGPLGGKECSCKVCKTYTRSYINHSLRTKEPLGKMLATYHNLYFIQDMFRDIRAAIKEKRFEAFRKEFLRRYENESNELSESDESSKSNESNESEESNESK